MEQHPDQQQQNEQEQGQLQLMKGQQLNEYVEQMENQYAFSVSLSQTQKMLKFMHQMSNQCINCSNNGPDLITYPSAKQNWLHLQEQILSLNTAVLKELTVIYEGVSKLEVAGKTTKQMTEDLNKHLNPIEIACLYKNDLETIKNLSGAVLACFKNININQVDSMKEMLQSLATQIGTNSLNALLEVVEKIENQIVVKRKELKDFISSEQVEILKKSQDLMQSKGIVAEYTMKTNQLNQLIASEQQHCNQLDAYINSFNQMSKNSMENMEREIADMRQKQQRQLDELKNQEDAMARNRKEQFQRSQEKIEEAKRSLEYKIANPKQTKETSTSYSSSRSSGLFGFFFLGGRSSSSSSTSERIITEDTSQFKNDLRAMQEMSERENRAQYESQEMQNKAFSQQKNYLMESVNNLSKNTMQNSQQAQQLFSQQVDRLNREKEGAKKSVLSLTQDYGQALNVLTSNQQICATREQILKEALISYKKGCDRIEDEILKLTDDKRKKEEAQEQIMEKEGFHSIQSLIKSVNQIELLRQGVNARAHFIIYQIGMITSFDSTLGLVESDFEQAPRQILQIKDQAQSNFDEKVRRQAQQRRRITHISNEYPLEEYQNTINSIFKNNEDARTLFLQEGYIDVFLQIADFDPRGNQEEWTEYNIVKAPEKIVAKNQAAKIKKYLEIQEENCNIDEHNSRMLQSFQVQDDFELERKQEIVALSSDFNNHLKKSLNLLYEFIEKLMQTLQTSQQKKKSNLELEK